ncbi:MAG: hypothetical protein QGG42_22055 [Phycisphaerae bacterium]|jgi:hypothetical protein|nr:hypothetical protein [Phycisphaerae bacterium]
MAEDFTPIRMPLSRHFRSVPRTLIPAVVFVACLFAIAHIWSTGIMAPQESGVSAVATDRGDHGASEQFCGPDYPDEETHAYLEDHLEEQSGD